MPAVLTAEKIEDFREKLCDAALHIFASRGREGFTMRELAAAVGVSPMTPYRYFKDKDAILAAVRTRAFDDFAAALEAAFATPGDAQAKANAAGRAYIRFAFDHPEAYRLMFEIEADCNDEAEHAELLRATERARGTLTRHIHPLVDAGLLHGDPVVIGHVFWAALHGAVMLQLANKLTPECDFETLSRAMFRALTAGFGTPPDTAG